MGPTKTERRLRNAQTLLLIGGLFAAVLAASLLGMVGVPPSLAIAIGGLVYFACWWTVLRAIRRRRDATADTNGR